LSLCIPKAVVFSQGHCSLCIPRTAVPCVFLGQLFPGQLFPVFLQDSCSLCVPRTFVSCAFPGQLLPVYS
jgi:hypothetical protein